MTTSWLHRGWEKGEAGKGGQASQRSATAGSCYHHEAGDGRKWGSGAQISGRPAEAGNVYASQGDTAPSLGWGDIARDGVGETAQPLSPCSCDSHQRCLGGARWRSPGMGTPGTQLVV